MWYLFDADGVVIKTRGENFSTRFVRDYGADPIIVAEFYRGAFQDCLRGKRDLKKEFANLLGELKLDLPLEEVLEYWFGAERGVDENVLDSVRQLKVQGHNCLLCTNNERHRTDDLWYQVGLRNHFDGLITSCELGYVKTEPGFWQAVQMHLQPLTNSEILVIDDREDNLAAAKYFGYRTLLFKSVGDLSELVRL